MLNYLFSSFSWFIFLVHFKILMSVQLLLVYVEMDDVLILLAASVAIVSQDTPSPLTECDAEVGGMLFMCLEQYFSCH